MFAKPRLDLSHRSILQDLASFDLSWLVPLRRRRRTDDLESLIAHLPAHLRDDIGQPLRVGPASDALPQVYAGRV